MTFEFASAGRIVFGPGTLAQSGDLVRGWGRRALVVAGASAAARQRVEPLLARLAAAEVSAAVFELAGEPSLDDARAGTAAGRAFGAEVVVGFGGGSCLDLAKAVAALLANPGDPLDYVEVIGRGRPLDGVPRPVVAIPTTAGTGSEVTRNAVLGSAAHRVKASLRAAGMLPKVALVDPELTAGAPRGLTAACGLDALTQLLEPLVSRRANPLTDALCRDGLPRAARWLRAACDDEPEARTQLSLASLLGGLALANAGLGAVHGLAAPVGGLSGLAHGAVCAALLAPVMAANLHAGDERVRARYDEVARLLTGSASAEASDGVAWVSALVDELGLARLDLDLASLDELVTKAQAASSMRANPVALSDARLRDVLLAAAG